MCTSIVVNKKKTIVGWNLDIMDFEYRILPTDDGVFIEINDATEGWIPLFGVATDDFDVDDCFQVLNEVSQTVCPTVISMVFDVTDKAVYWCHNRDYGQIETKRF